MRTRTCSLFFFGRCDVTGHYHHAVTLLAAVLTMLAGILMSLPQLVTLFR